MLDQPIELVDVHEAVAVHPGHVTIDLSDHDLRGVDRRSGHVDRHAEAAVATLVRRRHLDERDVERPAPRPEQLRDLREKARQVVDAIPVELAAHVVADEEVRHAKRARVLRLGVARVARGVQVDQLDIAKTARLSDQGVHQGDGGRGASVNEHTLIGVDVVDRFVGGAELGHLELAILGRSRFGVLGFGLRSARSRWRATPLEIDFEHRVRVDRLQRP